MIAIVVLVIVIVWYLLSKADDGNDNGNDRAASQDGGIVDCAELYRVCYTQSCK